MKTNYYYLTTAIIAAAFTAVSCKLTAPAKSSQTESKTQHTSAQQLLQTEFEPAVLEGTEPPPVTLSRLAPLAKSPQQMMVPAGTELLSAGKPVTASDDFPLIGEISYITDGDKDGGEGYFVELVDGLQWVQIDLEQEASLAAIAVWHFNGWPRAYHDVIVLCSNDPEFADDVTVLFNNDYDNSAQLGKGRDYPYIETQYGKLIEAKGVNARYVRLYSNGNTMNDQNHYVEVEVYGSTGAGGNEAITH